MWKMILNQNQIRTNDQYEESAKSWTSSVGSIVRNRLFSDSGPAQGGPQN
ncbi:hypothetical protein Hanom_Chr17g01590501 [Helianthus anomalus]